MDWSRAKTILICAFLFLDLFLGYQVYASRTQPSMDVDSVKGLNSDLETYLLQQNITLETDIPQDTPDMRYLYVEYVGIPTITAKEMSEQLVTLENALITSQFTKDFYIGYSSNPEEVLRQLKDRIVYYDQYRVDQYWLHHRRYRYWQVHDGIPLFVAPLEIFIENGVAKGYKQVYLHVRSQGSGRQVIPASTAVRSLVEKGIIKKGERIEQIALGYYGYKYDAEIQVLAPVWRIIHNGNEHYVNGFTGVAERPQVLFNAGN